jgi:two-component system chemotaxis sensor kinase CheA
MGKLNAGLQLDDFEAEARVHLDHIEAAFLDVAALAVDPSLVNGVFRAVHSIKGTAGFFSLGKIVAVTHELESVFTQIKEGRLCIDENLEDLTLQSVDCLKALVDNLQDEDSVDITGVIDTLKHYSEITQSKESNTQIPFDLTRGHLEQSLKDAARYGHKLYYVYINYDRRLGKYYKQPMGMIENILSVGSILGAIVENPPDIVPQCPDLAALTAGITGALAQYDTTTLELLVTSVLEHELFSVAIEIDEKYVHLIAKETTQKGDAKSEIPPETAKERAAAPMPVKTGDASIRLGVSIVNNLMDLSNEMILTRNQLLSVVSRYRRSTPGLTQILHDMNRLTSELQEKIMLTRMQPISVIFSKFQRIIRDASKMLNKDIQLEVFGDDVMLDKYMLEALTDPITQIVKNSADHGIEHAERRAELKKPSTGRITLSAYMRDSSAIIEISDDGAGINAEALMQKALERGTATREALSAMPESEIFLLIFEAGVSTAEQVTSLSGRGVGMDIVKTNIEKLGGTIEIDSHLNVGTTLRLKMPLTLSIIRVLIVEMGGVQYAIPESNVKRIVRVWRQPGNTTAKRIELVDNRLILCLDGGFIPIVTMEEIEAAVYGASPPAAAALLEQYSNNGVVKCLVMKAAKKSCALLIGNAMETVQTLAKPLPVFLKNCLCYANVTVLGNGNTIAVLDAKGITHLMKIEAVDQGESEESAAEPETDTKQFLLFKCSGTEHYALEMKDVARIERIWTEQIEEIGRGLFANVAGQTVHVVRPEDFVPVCKKEYAAQKLCLLMIKTGRTAPIGLLAEKLLDDIEEAFTLDTDRIYSDFIFGTSVFREKVLIFLNPGAIAEEVEKNKQRQKNTKKKAVRI